VADNGDEKWKMKAREEERAIATLHSTAATENNNLATAALLLRTGTAHAQTFAASLAARCAQRSGTSFLPRSSKSALIPK
jgi:hypothetical protein